MNKPAQIKPSTTVADELDRMDAEREARMRIWNAVCRTNPNHTKHVNQRGGFTAISAHYQVMSATEAFGPIGIGWGYINGEPVFHETLVIVPVTLWHGDRSNSFGPVYGAAEWKNNKGYVDSDAAKKAATDGLTKALSHLGFNADVFLGRFEDNKYVAELQKEFAPKPDNPTTGEDPAGKRQVLDGPYTSKTALWKAFKEFDRTLRGIGDLAEFEAFLQTDEAVELIDQCKRDAPSLYETGEGLPAEFEPALALIKRLRADLTQSDEIRTKERA